jgi:AAA+ ATPase superfamily predicted ATPase
MAKTEEYLHKVEEAMSLLRHYAALASQNARREHNEYLGDQIEQICRWCDDNFSQVGHFIDVARYTEKLER